MRHRAAVRALAVAAAAAGVTVAVAGPARAQILPPVTTPPIDIGVPGLGIGVHVPGQEIGGSSGPTLPGVGGLPPVPGSSAPGGSNGSPGGGPAPQGTTPPEATPDPSPLPADPPAPPPSAAPGDAGSSQAGERALDAGARRPAGGPSLGSAIAGVVTEPSTIVGALTLALGFGVVVGAAPYLPRYRRRQRELLAQWALASEREHTVAAKLTEADQQKSEFLALVSHELRTPLTAVKGFVDTVLLHWERLADDRRRELLTRASSNADELGRLVRQLMEFGRTESGPIQIAPDKLDVAAAVDLALLGIAPVTAGHRMEVDVPDGLVVDADADAFNHVLVNLLTNAVKFSPAGSRVLVGAHRTGNEIVVSVADEGAGVAPEEKERIFDRFYQSRNGDHARGTGIGLTIAQRFTAQHGGRIWVDSEPGQGATFSFTMPVAAGERIA
ncbi:MAG TPA: ATP-binding protein [Acidimicrobiia bacterium]|nr:ATP-binding protein [Acidimicrobiia bacterium]